ncbi:hypothetical protein D2T81_11715 [Azospirillum brasilense]|nr:hypothetical protein D2T81_11715 [Azospirillum brasilense]
MTKHPLLSVGRLGMRCHVGVRLFFYEGRWTHHDLPPSIRRQRQRGKRDGRGVNLADAGREQQALEIMNRHAAQPVEVHEVPQSGSEG